MEIQMNMVITGLRNAEDMYGLTVIYAEHLRAGERYQVKEMTALTQEMGDYWAGLQKRGEMREFWSHGMNIEAHERSLPTAEEFHTKGWEQRWQDEIDIERCEAEPLELSLTPREDHDDEKRQSGATANQDGTKGDAQDARRIPEECRTAALT
jgi:hypothetical protein